MIGKSISGREMGPNPLIPSLNVRKIIRELARIIVS